MDEKEVIETIEEVETDEETKSKEKQAPKRKKSKAPVVEPYNVRWMRARQKAQMVYGKKRLPDDLIEQFLE